MHDTAFRIGQLVMQTYCDLANARILEIGSLDVNGCLRDAAEPTTTYVGIDMAEGPSVDLIVAPGADFPVEADSFDLVMASSVFEHDPRFWDTFLLMCRATRPGGHVYINAPSNGAVHRYPLDCWRFYPDAGVALVQYAAARDIEVELVESFVAQRQADIWNDFVAVFRKGPRDRPMTTTFVCQLFPSTNARTWQSTDVQHESALPEDAIIIQALCERCDGLAQEASQLGQARAVLADTDQRLAAVSAELKQDRAALAGARDQISALVEQTAQLAILSAELEQARAALADKAVQIEGLAPLAAQLPAVQAELKHVRTTAIDERREKSKVLGLVRILQEENAKQGDTVQRLQAAVAKKDGNIAWIQKLHKLLEAHGRDWQAYLPPQMRQRRMMNILRKHGHFDAENYMSANPRVEAAQRDPLTHFILHGLDDRYDGDARECNVVSSNSR